MSPISLERLESCNEQLQELFKKVDEFYPLMVIEGHRGKEDQDKAIKEGKSKVQWPNGKHNSFPSRAIDVAFLPLDWNDSKKWYHFIGFVLGVSKTLGINVRSGSDWDMDLDFKDQKFNDLCHWELKE